MSSITSSTTEQAAVRSARLADLIEERLSPERAAAVRELAHTYVRRLGSEAAEGPQVEALLSEIVGAFEFAAARGRAPIAVRAFNPTLDEHGYEKPGSVLETNTEDLPFLVDSVTGEIERRDLRIARVVHPIVGVERDRERRIVSVLPARAARLRESLMHFDLDRRLSDEELAELEGAVRRVLSEVRRVVRDFNPMRERIQRMIDIARAASAHYPLDEIDEITAFLVWLLEEHFVFLGYREYEIVDGNLTVVKGSGLGLLDDPSKSSLATPKPLQQLDAGVRARIASGELLDVTKTNRHSPVHRPMRMDYIGVRRVDEGGDVVGEARLIGLFTTNAYSEPASQTPMLRGKLRRIIEAEDLIEGSHDYKAVVSLFDSFPKDELLAAPTEDLRRALVALLGLYGDSVRLLGRRDADGRSASAIAALPAARYNPRLADQIRELLVERFATAGVDQHLVLSEPDRVQLHYSIHSTSGQLPVVSFRALQLEVVGLARTWDERLRERLTERRGAEHGRRLAAHWAPRLADAYKASTDPRYAAHDVECLDRLRDADASFVVGMHNASGKTGERTRVGLYKHGGKVELSSFLPILETLGLRVYEELPTRLADGDDELFIQDFGVLGPDGRPLDLGAVADRVAGSIAAVWRGEAESDSLNRLIVTAGLDWRQVAVLRGYRRYRQRVGSRFSQTYEDDVLADNPEIVAKLVRLFELRFDPQSPRDEAAEEALHAEIKADLDAVESLDHDRILRDHLRLLDATLRTNAFRGDRRALALKLRSAAVGGMPQPAPLYEIFVYSPEMEGIHLRGGKVARGGIRWSDRMDYRTEIFGLLRAQMTKNALIVPTGAKGGFILKRPPAERAAVQEEVARQYVTYIRSLLDLTDNRLDGKIVHPPAMRVLDDDDPYLVVAADKGTAALSDAANTVAEQQGFWLGDGFAAGGSTGYDHKALGITARGAWESVKRHFRELDTDPETDPFTAVGIGDMSGDVFGNGMLLSRRIRLIAAYDHRHVFIDPDPDPAASWEERKRLFELSGSSWDDYDRTRMSAGGGVWPRKAKSIPLSPEARAALGIEAEALPPTEVIRAILRAPVDLLWNGGIGTVVKASTETHADARDRASDQIRVDARELRCRVVAEGGNLGFTQRGRIEFAAAGGRIAADFIDNSAGVNCSDHEVNLKILLGLAERRGELTREDRDALLEEITDDVVAHVLYASFEQAQILSQEVPTSAERMDAYEDVIALLERSGLVDREVDALPSAQELLRRRRAGQGMLRPEIAVLLAHAKRSLTERLESSDLPDDPYLERELEGYFPARVVERFGHLLSEHPLRRELIATSVAGDVLDALGSTFVARLMAERGAGPASIVRAFRMARDVTRAGARWRAVERLGRSVPADVQDELMSGVDHLVESVARWYLMEMPGADLGPTIEAARPAFDRLQAALAAAGSEGRREERDEIERRLFSQGVPPELARAHALGPELRLAPDIIAVANETGRPVEEVAEAFVAVSEGLGIGRCDRAVADLPVAERAERWARQALRDDVLHARRDIARRALTEAGGEPHAAVEAFLAARPHGRRRLELFVQPLGGAGGTELASVTLAVRELRALAES